MLMLTVSFYPNTKGNLLHSKTLKEFLLEIVWVRLNHKKLEVLKLSSPPVKFCAPGNYGDH